MPNPTRAITFDEFDLGAPSKTLTLQFPPSIESVFRQESADAHHKSVAANWLIGCALYDMFILSDYFVAGDYFKYYLIGRIFIMTPVCLLSIFLIWKNNKYYQFLIGINPLIMAINLSILIIISHGSYRSDYLFGDILLMICGYVISRPRLPYVVGTVILQCIFYMAVLGLSDAISNDGKIVSALFGLSGAVVTIITAYALEQESRAAFLLGLRVRLLNQELAARATTDPLTGLGNRRLFEDTAAAFWAEPSTTVRLASLILIDVDHFKSFNDNYGHSAGDLCLSTLARQIAAGMRNKDDLAIRFGGEEIVVFLPNTDFTEARNLAEKLRLAICAAHIPHPVTGAEAIVTASLGVATAPTTACTCAELVVYADMALYAAKHNGRNQVWPPIGLRQGGTFWGTIAAPTVAALSDRRSIAPLPQTWKPV